MTTTNEPCCSPGCCDTPDVAKTETRSPHHVRDEVRAGYARIATGDATDCGCGCGTEGSVTERVGYDRGELASLPEGADMGLSCGNPIAIASLQLGEVVLDLGAGGGLDVFLAGPRVGEGGRAIGVDMTPEMIMKAREGIAHYREHSGFDNVEFRLGEIEHLPVSDAGVDVVVSNCVINLSPDKPQVWSEIGRVLRPGGRVSVSDLVRLQPLPGSVAELVESWIGCMAGASAIDEIEAMATAAGLESIQVEVSNTYTRTLDEIQDPLYQRIIAHLPQGQDLGAYIASATITAARPH